MNNKNNKIIGYDQETGFPIYEENGTAATVNSKTELTQEEKDKKFSRWMKISLFISLLVLLFQIKAYIDLNNIKTTDHNGSWSTGWAQVGFLFQSIVLVAPFQVVSIIYACKCQALEKNWLSVAIMIFHLVMYIPFFIMNYVCITL